jgi:RNA-directed DNA polymerase
MKERGFAVVRYADDAVILCKTKERDKVRKITRRQQGNNLGEMIKKVNEVSRGFGNYFGIGNVKKKFQRLDEWTRMRVRAFMRKKKSTVSNSLIPNKVLEAAGMVFLTNLLTTRF